MSCRVIGLLAHEQMRTHKYTHTLIFGVMTTTLMVIERNMVKMYAFIVTEFILTIKSSCSSDKKIILCWLSRYRNRVEMDRKVESNGMSSVLCHAKMRFIIFLLDMSVCAFDSRMGIKLSFFQPVSQPVSQSSSWFCCA